MSEIDDKESKTEEASEKKIQDALEKGNTPHSRELVIFGSLLGMVISGYFLIVEQARIFAAGLQTLLSQAGTRQIGVGADATNVVAEALVGGVWFAAPTMLLMMILGIAASLGQSAPRLVLDRIMPKANRISPGAGLSRILGLRGQVEFAKSTVKLLAVAVIAFLVILSHRDRLADFLMIETWQIPIKALEISRTILDALTIFAFVIVVVDLLWSRLQWRSDLRMSHKELKDEHKESEGDPILRSRRRSIALQRSRTRMMNAVPDATLVVVNPTHFAVALKYVKGETPAPMIVAKGLDKLALRIKATAEFHGVPVIEDRLLARSLYKAVEVDQIIRPEFYKAVAELILMVQNRSSRELHA